MDVPPPSNGVPSGEPSGRTYHRRRAPRRPLLAAAAFTATGAWAFLRWKPFRVEVKGSSMRPALEPGDWALAVSPSRVARGDVVVVEHPAQPGFEIVKRVVAVPGDLAPDGRVLAQDAFWVEGDSPNASTDSRHFGPVDRAHITARVRLVYWPLERRRLV
jgi:nickel-type superoxide dismutase maturation protease